GPAVRDRERGEQGEGDKRRRHERQSKRVSRREGEQHGGNLPTCRRQDWAMLEVFPETAAVEAGELTIGGLGATRLAAEFGTPLLVYDERTMLDAARAYRAAAPNAFIADGVEAFPTVGVLALRGR